MTAVWLDERNNLIVLGIVGLWVLGVVVLTVACWLKERQMKIPGLRVGRTVGYVMQEGFQAGVVRPAVVVNVWDEVSGVCNLQVFTDGENDGVAGVLWKTSVTYSEAGVDGQWGTWHFID